MTYPAHNCHTRMKISFSVVVLSYFDNVRVKGQSCLCLHESNV